MSISIFFSPARISNHLLTSYHSGNPQFLIPWISTGQESRPPFMHRNQFIHHYTMHQNNILRAKVEAGGVKPKHLSSQGKRSGIFKSKEDRRTGHPQALCLAKTRGIRNGPEFLDSNLELKAGCPKTSADGHNPQGTLAVNTFTGSNFLSPCPWSNHEPVVLSCFWLESERAFFAPWCFSTRSASPKHSIISTG